MKHKLNQEKAQFSLEFAVLIVCIVGALIAMQYYIRRGLQGGHRKAADTIGEQYDVKNTTSDITDSFNSDINTTVTTTEVSGVTTSTTHSDYQDSQARTGTENVGPLP